MKASAANDPYVRTLEEKVNPARTAVLVVDYQNDFVAEGGAFDTTGADVGRCRAIAPALSSLLGAARRAGVVVMFVQSVYSTNDSRYLSRVFLHQARRTHNGRYHEVSVCQPNTWGCDFVGDVRPETDDAILVKHRFNAFFNTDLDLLLRSQEIESIIATGVTTDTCVESTIRDAFFRDYYVIVPRQCVGAFSAELHDGALERIDRLYGEVTDLDQILRVWNRGVAHPEPESIKMHR